MTEAQIDDFLDYVIRTSNLAPSVLRLRPSLRDPDDDERILEVAAQCRALIVTHNEKDFVGGQLGVLVRTPAQFLKILREGQ